MTGDIDMGKNRLLKLPEPTDAQEAATKGYSDAQAGQPTKEFFIPVTVGTLMTSHGYFPVARCGTLYDVAFVSFGVPHDFSSLVTAELLVICRATQAAAAWTIGSDYGAAGELWNNHHEYDITTTYNVTNNELEIVDLSGILTYLAADDYVGVRIRQGAEGHNFDALGVHFKYS